MPLLLMIILLAEQSPINAGYNLDIDYVYNYKGSSAVAIDHYWLLTAAHVADNAGTGNLSINGEIYNQQEIIFHNQADLALVRFDKALPGYYFMDGIIKHKTSGLFGSTVWHKVIMAGYGLIGSVTNDYFTQTSNNGTLRWGTNLAEAESTETINVGGTTGNRTSSCFRVDFDLNDTEYEAGANLNDSGGAAFATNTLGNWELAGIIAYRLINNDNNGTGNMMIKLSDYTNWIKIIIIDYDSDKDFLPDWWEQKHSGSTTGMNAQADEDNDTVSNYEEWQADTNPTNNNSFFHITEYSTPTNITFTSSTNRQFQIKYKTNLKDINENWTAISAWFIGDNSQTTYNLPAGISNRFYCVNVKLL